MTSERGSALLLEADAAERGAAEGVLAESGLGVAVVNSAELALRHLELYPTDVVVADADLPGSGVELLRKVNALAPETPVILTSARGDLRAAVAAMRAGAADFLARPLSSAELAHAVNKALTATEQVRDSAPVLPLGGALLGDSRAIREVYATVRRAAPTLSTVLVRGESGTGKELVARLIHDHSPRADGPFVRVHCAALPDALLESELFGYEKGAFTGAASRKPGRVELAEGGTLFLDEIGDITPAMQVKLLRLLQEREYDPLGGTRTVRADVRFVAATNRKLEEMVRAKEFREDLFYRLNVVPIWMPALREHAEDIGPLAQRFFAQFAQAAGRAGMQLGDDAVAVLRARRWRGNVRELQNFIERVVVLSESDRVGADAVSRELSRQPAISTVSIPAGSGPLEARVRAAEREALQAALRSTNDNRAAAARLLGISRRTLYTKLEEHGLS
ncbi:MAG: sigma-54-dependent Fis family transcriptional regulator [Polyangiaceae bacterium]|nr:sigma-54-dependent Fis family transcriptional regulator [Polyangiaceae bacterium]MCE7888469.1 sigma-54-dependent Fis family transcriptional regulator [Sorangiineae bacterium PRO1]MCL4754663.1 sigma-54 dependent transcriptional regulator [Myxococcales bacterium]